MANASAADRVGIWEKLRHRKVVQWGIAYAAGAWGFLQGFQYVSEAFGWPDALRRVAILAALVGLPIALIVAWYHGDRGRQRVTTAELAMIALLAAAGVLFSIAATSAWLLARPGLVARTGLTDARFSTLTDFEGAEQAAAISRDGKFVAFLSDREGAIDVWVTQVGTGEFHNLTRGRAPESLLQEIRTVAFSPDASFVTFWGRTQASPGAEPSIDIWSVPTMGGPLRRYIAGAAELDWSNDGTRVVYHLPTPGDPLFVTAPGEREGRQVYIAPPGTHCHFPTWSPDDAYLYFVRGVPGGDMDIWRVRPDGSGAERMTNHHSLVSHPVFLDRRTLLYLATAADGSGPWLHALDTSSGESRRLNVGADRYTSLAGSADGRRLVATVARPRWSLWRMQVSEHVADASAAARIPLPTTGGRAPRLGPGFLVYVSSKRDQEGIWRLTGASADELWSMPDTRIVGGPAISPDGKLIAFAAERGGTGRLHVITADGTELRALAESLDVRGSPDWSRDGRSIAVAAQYGSVPRVFSVPLGGGAPVAIVEGHSVDPRWSPTGAFLTYSGPEIGPSATVMSITADGRPHHLPPLTVTRGAMRVGFLADDSKLVLLRGEFGHGDFWVVDLATGHSRRLSNFGGDFTIGDFDVAPDGRELVFDRRIENTDLLVIDR